MLLISLRRGSLLVLLLCAALAACSQTYPPVQMYSVTDWNPSIYAPDILYRYSPTTDALAASATATYTNATEVYGPNNCLTWLQTNWAFTDSTENDPAMTVSMVVDMGRTFCVGEVDMRWYVNQAPQTYELEGSTDGVNYSVLVAPSALSSSGNMLYVPFTPTTVQYLKLICTGSCPTGTLMSLDQFNAYASTLGPPLTNIDNLSATELLGSNATVTPLTSNWNGYPNGCPNISQVIGFHWNYGYTAMNPDPVSGENAQFEIDLGEVYSIFNLSYSMFASPGPAVWQYGGQIDVSTDNTNWSTVYQVNSNMSPASIDLRGSTGYTNVRYIRFTDYANGTSLGNATLGCVVPFLYSTGAAPTPLATVTVPSGATTMSAAIYNRLGEQQRQLIMAAPVQGNQQVSLYWDGKDLYGNVLPNGVYEWRTAYCAVTGGMDTPNSSNGTVGNSGNPPWGTTCRNGFISDCDCDSSSNVYEANNWQEDGTEVEQLTSSGAYGWSLNTSACRITTDGTSVFYSRPNYGGNEVICKVSASNGAAVNFSGLGSNVLTINTGTSTANIGGLSADGTNLWVSDDLTNQVRVYNEATGALEGSFSLTSPQGIATQSGVSGVVWVANNGAWISEYTYPANFSSFTENTNNRITGLNAPASMRIGGPGTNGHLYVIESGLQRVREFNLGVSPPQNTGVFATFGQAAVAGPMTPTGFCGLTGLAIDGTGGVHLGDNSNWRVQHFNASGALTRTDCASWDASPSFVSGSSSSTYTVLNGQFEYEVDSQGLTHNGWLGDGTWTMLNHWFDGPFCSSDTLRRTLYVPSLGCNRDYLFSLGNGGIQGVTVYQLNTTDTSFRRSAIVGTYWAGVNDNQTPAQGNWTWSDTNGDGQIEFTGTVGQDQTTPDLVTWGPEYLMCNGGMWVDFSGNIYYSGVANNGTPFDKGSSIEVPLEGFDALGNPLYDWNHAVAAAPPDDTTAGFWSDQLVVGPNGDSYLVGNTTQLGEGFTNCGGAVVRRFNDTGDYVSQLLQPAGLYFSAAFQADPVAGTGYQYTGFMLGIHVGVWSADGLLLCHVMPPQTGDPNIQVPGGDWYDHGQCMDVYHLNGSPSGTRYIYSPDVYGTNMVRYIVQNLGSETYVHQCSSWPTPESGSTQDVLLESAHQVCSKQGSTPATFRIVRAGVTTNALTVYYSIGGTAVNGTDYQTLSGSAVIPAGQDNVVVSVTSLDNTQATGDRTVTLTLSTNAAYNILTQNSATLTIIDNALPNLIVNPGFEEGNVSWTFGVQDYMPDDVLDGNLCGVMTTSNAAITQTVALTPNTAYLLSVWGKSSTTSQGGYLYVQGYDTQGSGDSLTAAIPGTNYQQSTITFTTGANVTSLLVGVNNGPGAGSSCVDDFKLYATQCIQPSFTPLPGCYTSPQTVTISTTSSGATIRYTTDGSTPSETQGTLYSTAVTLSNNCTLQAIAYETGLADSAVASGCYLINTGTLIPNYSFEIPSLGNTFQYNPSGASWTFTGSSGEAGNGSGFNNPNAPSGVQVALVQGQGSFSQALTWTAGTYTVAFEAAQRSKNNNNQNFQVLIDSTVVGTFTPSSTSFTGYSTGSFAVTTGTHTLQFTGLDSAGNGDTAFIDDVIIDPVPTCATPTFTPAAGTFSSTQTVTIGTTTGGASIRYTTDGSTPSSTAGTVYSSPVSITATSTLQAIAYEAGYTNSAVASGLYTITAEYTHIDCGNMSGSAASPFVADNTANDYSGGNTKSYSANVTTTSVVNPAPMSVYQTERWAPSTYTISGLLANTAYIVRLHFCENNWTGPGERLFNVAINSTTVLSNYDIYADAGGQNIATVHDFAATSTGSGQIVIAFTNGSVDNAKIDGIEILTVSQCALPSFTPTAGTYTSSASVSIGSSTGGATIRYTTDGSLPSETHGTVYSSAVLLSSSCTLQAIAYKAGMADSSTASGAYTIQCATPTFTPTAGTYSSAQNVTISTTTGGASIRYTTNGTTPSSTAGTVYSSPVAISATSTLQAIAYETGLANSSVASGVYTINNPCATPTFNPAAGTFTTSTSVTISTTTTGAAIRYTTNGTTPSSTVGTVYSSPVSLTATCTLQAIAYETGYTNSTVASGVYTIQCATPTFTPAAGSIITSTSVTIATSTSGATIRYTTNGTTPSSTVGTVYSTPVSITTTCTLQAIAYETGLSNSSVASGVYTIWNTSDIGTVGTTGSASYASPTFTVAGAGADIWGSADAFRYVYQQISGNCTIIARVATQQNTNAFAKAGVMMRADLTAGAANAFIAITPGEGVNEQARASAGAGTSHTISGSMVAPYYVKLVRSGSNFTTYSAPDGTTWTQIGGTNTITMTDPIYIGLAVCSHDDPTLCTATFDNVTITSP